MGPITEQRSGLGGGRVVIIGGPSGRKLSAFVLNSSVLRGWPGFLCFSWTNINMTSPCHSLSQLHSEGGSMLVQLIHN